MYDMKALYEASSVENAVALRLEHPEAQIIAGGSDVLVQMREGKRAGKELISIYGLDELRGVTIDASPIPDLIPVLSVVASVAAGETRVENASRLRLKESDRLQSTANLLRALGGRVEEKEDGLVITGVPALHGGSVETQNDHRLAMSAAVAACAATGEVTVDNDACVAKSYPRFWEDYGSLKGEGL